MPPIYLNPAASERELLVQLLQLVDANHTATLERLITMSQIAQDTQAAVTGENTKIDQLIALVGPAVQALRDQLAAAVAQAAALQTQLDAAKSDQAADAATLTATLSSVNDEATKVQAAIDTLSPPPAPAPVA